MPYADDAATPMLDAAADCRTPMLPPCCYAAAIEAYLMLPPPPLLRCRHDIFRCRFSYAAMPALR